MHFITKVCFWGDKSVAPLSVVYLGNIVQQGFKYLFTSTYPRFIWEDKLSFIISLFSTCGSAALNT